MSKHVVLPPNFTPNVKPGGVFDIKKRQLRNNHFYDISKFGLGQHENPHLLRGLQVHPEKVKCEVCVKDRVLS